MIRSINIMVEGARANDSEKVVIGFHGKELVRLIERSSQHRDLKELNHRVVGTVKETSNPADIIPFDDIGTSI